MNERIRQLALQSGVVMRGTFGKPMNIDELEKFAELIVQECIGVVEGGSFLHDQAPTAIFARECSGAIKRHFGVEL
jgi:wyosine [tRNA(Phe)-imidazoG37] synthetase (radical SAM superfamily)